MISKSVTIVYSGFSVENTPKLNLVVKALESNGYDVFIKGIVKVSTSNSQPGLYQKGQSQGLIKLVKVFSLQIKLFFHLLFRDKSEFLYSVNTVSGLVVMIICKIKRKKYVYEAHEIVFGVSYPFFKGSWRKFWVFIERKIIKHSDYFFTTDKHRLRLYALYLNLHKKNQGYLLNVPESFQLAEKQFLKKKYGLIKKKIISYCGGVIPGRNIEEIIGAFSTIEQHDSQLIIAGSVSDEYKNELLELSDHYGVRKNVLFTGSLENTVLKEYMKLSDITFTLYQSNSLNNRFSSPNKVFDAIHTETYFIASDSPLVHEIVSGFGVGEIVKQVNVENLAKHLNHALSIIETLEHTNFNNAKNYYCWENEQKKIDAIFKDLV